VRPCIALFSCGHSCRHSAGDAGFPGQSADSSEVLHALLSQLDPDGERGRARAASSAPGGVSAGLVPVVAASPCGASLTDAAVVQPRHVLLAVLRGPAQVLEAATRERVADALAGAPPADLGEYSITSGVSLLGSSGVSYLDSSPAIQRRRLSFEAFRALSLVFLRAVVEDAGQVTWGVCVGGGALSLTSRPRLASAGRSVAIVRRPLCCHAGPSACVADARAAGVGALVPAPVLGDPPGWLSDVVARSGAAADAHRRRRRRECHTLPRCVWGRP